MKGVTIDKLDLKDHVRWANDQRILDAAFVQEAQIVASHPEIMGTSAIYPSKLEELFEMQKRNVPWACFAPPDNFQSFNKRFFSYRLFPNIYWEEGDNENEKEKEKDDLEEMVEGADGEDNDKKTMMALVEEIKWINELLKQINARKLQYQKG